MLIGFTFENFTSFYNETQFSMMASRDRKFRDINTFTTKHGELLKNCVIYGANASGKTNLVDAIQFVSMAIISPFDYQVKLFSANRPFRFNSAAKNKPTKFEISFIPDQQDGVMYEYSFALLDGKVVYERLDKKNGRPVNIFEREGSQADTIKINDTEFKMMENLIQNTREEVLFLSLANFANNKIAKKICDWFDRMKFFGPEEIDMLTSETVPYIQNEENRKAVIEYLQNAGIDVDGLDFDQKRLKKIDEIIETIEDVDKRNELEGLHGLKERAVVVNRKVYDENWENPKTIKMDIFKESDGTLKTFRMAGSIVDVLKNGGVAVVDEIDSKLHPMLVKYIVMTFNSIDKNPKNAQLICTSHNVNLLEENIRKDQIYFVEKNKYGVSDLYSLSDFKDIGKNSKILKNYLLGSYGALPNISE